MRAGVAWRLNTVVNIGGAGRATHGYLFANARATPRKALVRHDRVCCTET
jgi:hypothetical protein